MQARIWWIRSLVVMGVSAPVVAGPVTFEFTDIYTSSGTPAGSAPWLKAEFKQSGNDVQLTLSNLVQGASEFITDIAFNFSNANVDVGDLVFTYSSGQAFEDIDLTPPINGWGDAGPFDLELQYENANNADRFTMGEMSTYIISDTNGDALNPMDFLLKSTATLPSFAAMHLQGISGGGSAKIRPEEMGVIPLPAGGSLATAGIALLMTRRRRRS